LSLLHPGLASLHPGLTPAGLTGQRRSNTSSQKCG
jgi:hypothetical protein